MKICEDFTSFSDRKELIQAGKCLPSDSRDIIIYDGEKGKAA